MSYVSEYIKFSDLLEIKYRFDGEMVKSANSTAYRHKNINQLASYIGQPLTIGSWHPLRAIGNNAKTELMNLKTGHWNTETDYPYSSM